MSPIDFDGRVSISHTSIPHQTDAIARRFFVTSDMAKSGRFIYDQMNAT